MVDVEGDIISAFSRSVLFLTRHYVKVVMCTVFGLKP